jgi:hypothetical protein
MLLLLFMFAQIYDCDFKGAPNKLSSQVCNGKMRTFLNVLSEDISKAMKEWPAKSKAVHLDELAKLSMEETDMM